MVISGIRDSRQIKETRVVRVIRVSRDWQVMKETMTISVKLLGL